MGEETFLKGGITYSGDAKDLVLIYLKSNNTVIDR